MKSRPGVTKTLRLLGVGVVLTLWFAGCSGEKKKWSRMPGDEPAAQSPAIASQATAPPGAPNPHMPSQQSAVEETSGSLRVAGLEFSLPPSWQKVPPASSMRVAQYRIEGSAGPGEAAFFLFPEGEGGPTSDIVERWSSQFRDAQSSASAPRLAERPQGSLKITTIETSGTYTPDQMAAMMGGSPAAARAQNFALYGIIVEGSPQGRLLIKTVGPEQTLEAHRPDFETLVASMHLR